MAHEEGYALVVVPSQNSDRYWDRVLVDGAVISDPEAGDPNLAFLRGQGLPYVTIGRDPDAPDLGYWVDDDNDVETRAMLDHLLRAGGAGHRARHLADHRLLDQDGYRGLPGLVRRARHDAARRGGP